MKTLNVNLETPLFRKGFEALGTSKRFFSRMDFHVTIEFGFFGKGLNALRAAERPLSRVNTLVGRQVTLFGEAFLANWAFERARARATRFEAVALESSPSAFWTVRLIIVDGVDVLFFVIVVLEEIVFRFFDV